MDTTGRHARRGATGNRFSQRRHQLLTLAARRTARLQWTPELIALPLEELYVDDDSFALLGGQRIPQRRSPQAVARSRPDSARCCALEVVGNMLRAQVLGRLNTTNRTRRTT